MSKHDSQSGDLGVLGSSIVDRCRATGGVWQLPGGQILLPKVFGFCRGVTRALAMLDRGVGRYHESAHAAKPPKRLFLLGQIIHNPWVNDYFRGRGVRILGRDELGDLEQIITPNDVAIIPAFGVPLPIEKRLLAIGCQIVDTSCGDVRRLWNWAQKAAADGYGVLIFGRADHDETVVTKSRLEACGGKYVVAGKLEQVHQFCHLVTGELPAERFRELFDQQTTNAATLEPFERLAQVSQTTMLYSETIAVRKLVTQAFQRRFGSQGSTAGPGEAQSARLLFQPTVCKATQARQGAAEELCRSNPDLVVVVGGFGSSNTRHLYELAGSYSKAFFIENAEAIVSATELHTVDVRTSSPVVERDWLPPRRPLRIAVLAGASSPEIVVGEVMAKLAGYLGG